MRGDFIKCLEKVIFIQGIKIVSHMTQSKYVFSGMYVLHKEPRLASP